MCPVLCFIVEFIVLFCIMYWDQCEYAALLVFLACFLLIILV